MHCSKREAVDVNNEIERVGEVPDDEGRNRFRLAQSLAQAGARQSAEKTNETLEFTSFPKRDFFENSAEDQLGEPLTIREVARIFRCSTWTVRQRHLRSGLPHFRIGRKGKLLFYRKQVMQWILDKQEKEGR
jgi:hypothetical protein